MSSSGGPTIVQPLTFTHIANVDVPVIKESLMLANTAYTHVLRVHKRHLLAHVADIAKVIGSGFGNAKLYRLCVGHLLNKYLKTHDWFYPTLKCMLASKLNETETAAVVATSATTTGAVSLTPFTSGMLLETPDDGECALLLHKFTSVINACLKEKKMEVKRAKELETVMDSKSFKRIFT